MSLTSTTIARYLRPFMTEVRAFMRTHGKRGTPLLPQDVREGDGTETTFTCIRGQKPYAVFLDGAPLIEGTGDDYTVIRDGELHNIVFAVAPANAQAIIIWPQEA